MYRKEQTDELLAGVNSAQQYIESNLSKLRAEFETSKEKSDERMEELAGKARNNLT